MSENTKDNNSEFNNKYEHIEILLHKLQIENAAKNIEISKLRDEIQQFRKSISGTSINFPLPNEFKTRWETLTKTTTMDTFENISFNAIVLMRVINLIIKNIYEFSKLKIKQKVSEILKCLGINNKEENIKNFFEKFKKLIFQDYFNTIFKINNDDFLNEILSNIKNEIKLQNNLFTNEDINNIFKDLNGQNISNFIIELYYLCLYMNINEPQLTIKTLTEINYRYFNKNNYSNIEGFFNENDICLLVLNPPKTKNNINYKGIKPIVFIIDNPTKEIIDLCEKQNIDEIKKNSTYNSFCKEINFVNNFKENNIINYNYYNVNNFKNSLSNFYKSINVQNNNKDFYYYSINKKRNNEKNEIYSKDDYNYIYSINPKNLLNNKNFYKNNKSNKSELLNINKTKYKTIYKENLNPIKNIKKIQTRNKSFIFYQNSHQLLKKKNNKKSHKKLFKTNKSSSPFSPRNPFLIKREKNMIKNLIKIINTKNIKCTNFKSQKSFNVKNKILFHREKNNIILKIKGINQFKDFNSYIRKSDIILNSNKEEEKTAYNNIFEDKNIETINNISISKETIPSAKNENNIPFIEIHRIKLNKMSNKKANIPFTNKINQSEPNIFCLVDNIKPIKKYVKIPNKDIQRISNKVIKKEKNNIKKNLCNNQNRDNSYNWIYNNVNEINSNFFTTIIKNYKTNNNSVLSSNNYDNIQINMKNDFNNIQNSTQIVKSNENRNYSNSNSVSVKKVQKKKKHLSSNGIKRKKHIFNKNDFIFNRNNKKNSKDNSKETSYFSLAYSNSQIHLRNKNKRIKNTKSENKIKKNDKKFDNGKDRGILLYNRNIKNLNLNKKHKEYLYKINLNTEKCDNKNCWIESLRNSFKNVTDLKKTKIKNKNHLNSQKPEKINNRINNKKIIYLLNETKKNTENNNILNISKNNLDKYHEEFFNEKRRKSIGFISKNKKKQEAFLTFK